MVSARTSELLGRAIESMQGNAPRSWNDTYVFAIAGGDAFGLQVQAGTGRIEPELDPANASCTFRASEAEIIRLLDGGSVQTAWMRGDLEVVGDFPAAYR